MSETTWIAYQIGPIDEHWGKLQTVPEVAAMLAKDEAMDSVHAHEYVPWLDGVARFLSNFEAAKRLARDAGWEGDYRHNDGPGVFWLPDDTAFTYAFVWKQDNNGTTFVVTPHPLPWLDAL